MRQTVVLFLLIGSYASAQYIYGYEQPFFFYLSPSARSEALGKIQVFPDGEISSSRYNPSSIAKSNGVLVGTTYVRPHFRFLPNSYYLSSAAGYRVHRLASVGFSYFKWSFGDLLSISERIPTTSSYTLTLASEPLLGLCVGANANYYVWDIGIGEPATCWYFDLGALKTFRIAESERIAHRAHLNVSVMNVSLATARGNFFGHESSARLPSVIRSGASYEVALNEGLLSDSLKTIRALVLSEIQFLLNSEYHTAIRFGIEAQIIEVLTVRMGYFDEYVYDYEIASNRTHINQLTYGAGLQLPLSRITSVPLTARFDYTNLPKMVYNQSIAPEDPRHISSYSFSLTWVTSD